MSNANFKITKQSLESLKAEHITGEILSKLKTLENQVFIGQKEFLQVLEKTIGHELTAQYKRSILKYAEQPVVKVSQAILRKLSLLTINAIKRARLVSNSIPTTPTDKEVLELIQIATYTWRNHNFAEFVQTEEDLLIFLYDLIITYISLIEGVKIQYNSKDPYKFKDPNKSIEYIELRDRILKSLLHNRQACSVALTMLEYRTLNPKLIADTLGINIKDAQCSMRYIEDLLTDIRFKAFLINGNDRRGINRNYLEHKQIMLTIIWHDTKTHFLRARGTIIDTSKKGIKVFITLDETTTKIPNTGSLIEVLLTSSVDLNTAQYIPKQLLQSKSSKTEAAVRWIGNAQDGKYLGIELMDEPAHFC